MNTSTALHCPDCNAEVSPDMRGCVQCGADAFVWAESQRTPLILPGNPALSADVVRKRTSVPKIVVGATLSVVLLGAVLYYMPASETEEPSTSASAAAPSSLSQPQAAPVVAEPAAPTLAAEPVRAESLAAFTQGNTASITPADATPPVAVSRPAPAIAAAEPADAVSLVLSPLMSNTLNPGDRLQLRPSVIDRRTRRTVPGPRVEFTSTNAAVASVEPRSGLVVARVAGSTNVIIDGGAAGTRTVRLTVRATPPSRAVTVAPVPSRVVTVAPVPSRVVIVAPAPAADVARTTVSATPLTGPILAAAPAPVAAVTAPRTDVPDDGVMRSVVDRFVNDVRRDAVRNAEVTQFLADGASHRVTLVSGPTVVSRSALGVRVAFALRFSKFDGGGRPVTLVSAVSMDVGNRSGEPSSSAIDIGSLRRP